MTENARDILREWKSGTVFKVPSGYLIVRASDVHALLRELEEDGSGSLLEVMYQRLQDENAKLRELIGMIGNVCDGISEVCECCKNYSATNDECMMLEQMQEIGIESGCHE